MMSGGILKHAYEQGDNVGDYVCHLDGWTTTPPTEEGWYWAIHEAVGYMDLVKVCKLTEDYLTTENGPLYVFTHWLGPLPPPEPPTLAE